MTQEETLFNEIGNSIDNSTKGNLFGKPCFKVNGKAYICFFQNAMVFKLKDEAHKEALSLDGAQLFDPSGKNRLMKEWVQVPYDYQSSWKKYAESAIDYVG